MNVMPVAETTTLEDLLVRLPALRTQHAPGSDAYQRLKTLAATESARLFAGTQAVPVALAPFGQLVFPYVKMGAISSVDLLALDELIVFSFYWQARNLYRRVADVGANIGLHSILLAKAGYKVRAYEPDPDHVAILRRNLALNKCMNVEVISAALSVNEGQQEFIRVLGNTTGSHLAGAKPHPYGELKHLTVPTRSVREIMTWADLVKLDVEGHEAAILTATNRQDWEGTDVLLEIGSPAGAKAIFRHLQTLGVTLFTQQRGWAPARNVDDVPTHYREGLAFASLRVEMPWS